MAKNTGKKKRRQKRNRKNEGASDDVIVETVAEDKIDNSKMPLVSTTIEDEWEYEKPLEWGYKSKTRKRKTAKKRPKNSVSVDSAVKYGWDLVFDLAKHILIIIILTFVSYFLIIDEELTELDEMLNDDESDNEYEADYYLKMMIGVVLFLIV